MYGRNVCYALFDSRGAIHPLVSNLNCTWHNVHLLDHTLSNQSPEITLIETNHSRDRSTCVIASLVTTFLSLDASCLPQAHIVGVQR